jgi:hypothetical protein
LLVLVYVGIGMICGLHPHIHNNSFVVVVYAGWRIVVAVVVFELLVVVVELVAHNMAGIVLVVVHMLAQVGMPCVAAGLLLTSR